MNIYDWTIFWDNNSATMAVPFGPEKPDNIIETLDDEWVVALGKYYPKLRSTLEGIGFSFITVLPPREAVAEEIHHWEQLGYEE